MTAARTAAWLVLAALTAGCGFSPASLPGAGRFSGEDGASEMIVDRVWRLDAPSAGAAVAFLSDGTLVRFGCDGGYRLASWRRVSEDTLAFEEDGGTRRAQVGLVGEDVLALVMEDSGETRSYTRQQAPFVCA